jgi:uncharacterized membrane protein YkgB
MNSTTPQTPRKAPALSRRAKVVIAAVVLAACVGDTLHFLRNMERRTPTLKRWLPFAEELGRDDDLYQRHPDYLYPPVFLVLLRPLTHVPRPVAAVIWQMSKYAAIACLFAAAWSLASRIAPLSLWTRIASIIICARFVVSDLRHGNVNLFIAAAVIGAAWLFWRDRRFTAGLLVAAAACVKVTPALWGAYLIYKRQWRAVLGGVVGVVLALEVAPLLVITPSMNHALLGKWYHHVVGSFLSTGDVESMGMNQSLTAVTNRLLGRPELAAGESPPQIADLPDSTVRWIQRLAAAALLIVLAWSLRGAMPNAGAFAVEWSILAPFSLALSGYTWTGHFCLLILAVCVMIAALARRPRTAGGRDAAGLSIASFILILTTTDLITPTGREFASAIGLPLLSALLLAAGLVVLRERMRRDERQEPSARARAEMRPAADRPGTHNDP